jgi:CHAD domain-containing protein
MEIELKFTVPDKTTCERLQETEQLAGFLLSTGHYQDLHDTYLDTAAQDLQKAGYICRKREQADATVISLKQLIPPAGPLHRREEFAVSLSSSTLEPTLWPDSQTRSLVLQFTQHKPLIPLFEVRQKRFVRRVRSRGERLVAELCIDEVHIDAGAGDHIFYELEAELLAEGTESDLEKIQHCLQHEWGLVPQLQTKFERALMFINASPASPAFSLNQLRPSSRSEKPRRKRSLITDRSHRNSGTEQKLAASEIKTSAPLRHGSETIAETPRPRALSKKPGITNKDTMAEAARKTLYFHFKRMVSHEAGTRRGEDIEELHDMRVATRRMRAAIRVCGAYLDMKQIKPFVKQIRRAGRILGTVRDLDVFKQKAQAYLNTVPPDRQDELDPLFAVFNGQYQNARKRMLDFLDSQRYIRFKKEFEKFLKNRGAAALPAFSSRDEPVPQRIPHVLPIVLLQRLAAVRAYEDCIHARDISLERLHRLRIAFKGLRYTLEFFKEVLPQDAEQLIEELKRLQDHLGDIQDGVVTSDILRNFLTWGTWGKVQSASETIQCKPVIAPGVAAYLSVRQAELQHRVETFVSEWERLEQTGFFKRAAALIQDL